jgi:hypothetical protein
MQRQSQISASSPADSNGHAADCPHCDPRAQNRDSYADLFCDCHHWEEPKILADGTNIAWPIGWNEKQAEEWRQRNGLARPSQPGAGP